MPKETKFYDLLGVSLCDNLNNVRILTHMQVSHDLQGEEFQAKLKTAYKKTALRNHPGEFLGCDR